MQTVHWRYWLLLSAAVFTIEGLVYLLDPTIMFFLGDSGSYLYSAATGWIPPDRSWVFGRLIHVVTGHEHYLDALVGFQVLCSALTCLVLGFILIRFLSCSRAIAAVTVLLCAIEPIQLFYERYVMAETVSLLVFSLFLVTLLYYLRKGQIGWLLPLAALAMLAGSLRTVWVPITVVVALLAIFHRGIFPPLSGGGRKRPAASRRMGSLLLHLLVFISVSYLGYAWESSVRTGSDKGFFVLMAWSPLLAEPGYPMTPVMAGLTRDLPEDCRLTDLEKRLNNLWLDDCLRDRIKKHFADRDAANAFAATEARRILWNEPLGVLRLGFQTWATLWDDERLGIMLGYDRGDNPDGTEKFAREVKNFYGKDISGWWQQVTLTNQYFFSATGWYRWLSVAPLFMVGWWLATRGRLSPYSLVIAASAVLMLLITTVPMVWSTVRFYHAIAWLALIAMASSVDRVVAWRRLATGTPAPSGNFSNTVGHGD